ncbi:glycosyltransferase [Flavobacterium terrae]|uniref:Glycosyltransferase involved in cell wall bisynthesis n=1 Tax=Flavobacterium terrae TaxID=415425 RepID=A0A1M6FT43_9FLAO|nr:glycosyltransferase [Flavobacterium terrae]SHJ00830.1 Glycosyltransferase involved in cell wall bisynthesis [Flavobacterium terrae]
MKLFFPIDAFYPSQIGGPCNSVYWLTDELTSNGFEVQIFTNTIGIKDGLVKTNEYTKTYYGQVYYDNKKNYLKKIKLIYLGIKNSEILHLNGFFSKSSLLSFFISRLFFRHKKILISARGELSDKALIYNNLLKKIVLVFYKLFSLGVFFHSTSEKESDEIKKKFNKSRVFELPNYFKPKKRILNKIKNKDLLYIGRIHHKKSIHKMIEGLYLSKTFKKSDYKFIIVGNHEMRHQNYFDFLKTKISEYDLVDKIEFKGFKEGDEKEIIYASSYMTLMLSENENFGNVVVESLNQGTPVIASTGTPWSILEKNKCGYHIDNSPMIIAKIIDEVLEISNEEYVEMCDRSIRLVEDNFMMKTKINNWIEVYNQIYLS